MKIAIDHADAIVEAADGVSPEVIEYAIASGKPFLRYQDAAPDEKSAYKEFYQSL